jgi:hypothetical protein
MLPISVVPRAKIKVSFLQLPLCWVTPFSVDEPVVIC